AQRGIASSGDLPAAEEGATVGTGHGHRRVAIVTRVGEPGRARAGRRGGRGGRNGHARELPARGPVAGALALRGGVAASLPDVRGGAGRRRATGRGRRLGTGGRGRGAPWLRHRPRPGRRAACRVVTVRDVEAGAVRALETRGRTGRAVGRDRPRAPG